MASLKDLLAFIESNPPQGEEWYSYKWREELERSVPDWETLLRNPDNWPHIEAVRPRGNFSELCKLFVEELEPAWQNAGCRRISRNKPTQPEIGFIWSAAA